MKKALLIASVLFIAVISTACINNIAVQELNNKAAEYMEKGDYESAVNRLQASIDLDSTMYETYYNLGIAATNAQKYDIAIEAFENGIKIKPDYANFYFSLAVAQAELAETILEVDEVNKKEIKRELKETRENKSKDIQTELEELKAEKQKLQEEYEKAYQDEESVTLKEKLYTTHKRKIKDISKLGYDEDKAKSAQLKASAITNTQKYLELNPSAIDKDEAEEFIKDLSKEENKEEQPVVLEG